VTKRTWIIIELVVVAILIAGAGVYFWWDRQSPYDFPTGSIAAYKLDGNGMLNDGSKEVFYSWPILQRCTPDEGVQARIRAAISEGRNYSRTGGAACFDPGMAFRIGQGDQAVDVLICLHCRNVYFYRAKDREQARQALSISDAGIASFGELYNSIFPQAKSTVSRQSATIPTR
jgi:hypothetical protein